MSRAAYERGEAQRKRASSAKAAADKMLKALVAELNKLGVGEYDFKAISDNDGFDIDVKVRITRRPENWEARKAFTDGAIEYLASMDYWPNSGSCGKPTTKKSWNHSSSCTNNFTHAVVSPKNSWEKHSGLYSFDYVCSTHGKVRAIGQSVLAVIELPKLRVLDAKKIVMARVAERGRQLCAICEHPRSQHSMTHCDGCRELHRAGKPSVSEHDFKEKK